MLIKILNFFFIGLISISMPIYGSQQDIGIDEFLGNQLPPTITLNNSKNESVVFNDFFSDNTPILVNLVYFNCPLLCNQILDSFTDSLQKLKLNIGKNYKILTISFDPLDNHISAKKYKDKYIKKLGIEDAQKNWHFLTTNQENITTITDTVGFRYKYDTKLEEYLHTSALFVLTPSGKISRYIYGIEFDPLNLKLSLLEATKNKFISSVDRIILYCYTYDPDANSYTLAAMNIMKLGATLTLILIILFLYYLNKNDSSKKTTI